MSYSKKTVKDIDVAGKKVLLCCGFSVPQNKVTGAITDDKRVVAALPTIQYLLEQNTAVIAYSHLGKPKEGPDSKFSLAPMAKRLDELLSREVIMAADVVGLDATAKAAVLEPGQILLLENARFEEDETKNDPELARKMTAMADVYMSDAFGAVYRIHTSTAGAAAYPPAVSSFLIQRELEIMGDALANPKRPLVAILGSSRVSSKIGVTNHLLDVTDTIIISGSICYTFAKAQGIDMGNSLLEADWLGHCWGMMQKAKDKGVKLLLSMGGVAIAESSTDAKPMAVNGAGIPDGMMGMNIGPKTITLYVTAVKEAGTAIWSDPVGVFGFLAFAEGTRAVAQALAEADAITIAGGDDPAAAVAQLGYADKMTHISTGDGTSLEFLEGEELPGVACLLDK